MPRTPLFGLIQRSLHLARRSLDAPDPDVGALLESHAARRAISRRDFVASATTLGAAVALGGCGPLLRAPAPRRGTEPVVIVGAGIAGLTAGYRLRQAGVPVRIFEAQNRVGGRMYSLRDHFADGQVVELGGELIDTPHTHIRSLAQELGIELDDLAIEEPGIETETWFFAGRRRSTAEVAEAFRPVAERIDRELATLTAGDVTYREPAAAERLDRMSIAEWLDAAGVSGWLRELLDVGYTTEYGLEPDRQSALNLLLMIGTEPGPFEIFGESDERFHVRGGNDLITRALAERLSDAIETGTVLEAVAQDAAGGYSCTLRRGESSFTVRAPELLLTLPFTLLRQVRLDVALPAAKRRAIAELGYGTNAKLMIGFGERVWRTRHGSNGSVLTDLPFQLTWETSRHQPGRAGVLTNFTGGRHGVAIGQGTAEEQAAKTVADLERVFPGVGAARAGMREVRFHWPSHPWTLGSYACHLPGQWTSIRGAEGESVGALHFAGEHCSLDAQGFMEGGCETGEAAARRILERIGVAQPVPVAYARQAGGAARSSASRQRTRAAGAAVARAGR